MKKINTIQAFLLLPLLTFFALIGCEEDGGITPYSKPGVMEVTPVEALRGTEIAINGENLSDVGGIKFGSIDVANFDKSASSISLLVPDGLEEGETQITVYYPGEVENNLGPSASIPFKVLYEPLLSEVSPTQAKPTFDVTLNGNYLRDAFSLLFDSIVTPFEASQTSITTQVPDMEPGQINISVETPGGITTVPFSVLPKAPEIYSFAPLEGGRTGEEVKINGLFFLDVQSVNVGSVEVLDFAVVNDKEIVFAIPEGAVTDKVIVTTALGVDTSEADLSVIEIPFSIVDEGMHPQMQNWGWGGNDNFTSSIVAKSGMYSYERTYTEAWSGIQLHHGSLNLGPYSAVEVSVYGGPGTTGKLLNMNINWGANFAVEVVEGAWRDYTVSLEDLGNPEILSELIFQENGETGPAVPFTVYLDNIRLIE